MSVGSNIEIVEAPGIVGKVSQVTVRLLQRTGPIFERTVVIAAFLLLWDIAPRVGLINRTFFPPFSEVIAKGVEFYLAGKLMPHVVVSVGRAVGGFVAGAVVGVTLGLLIGWFRTLERYLNPLLQLLRQINSVSLIPVIILLIGIGYFANVAIIFWVVVWPILLSTISGIKYVDPVLVKAARSMGVSNKTLFAKVVLPSSIPSVITGMRLAATYSFLMLVVSEMVGASSGLGYLILNAQYLLAVHLIYVSVIVLALLGILTNWALVRLERRLTVWKETIPT